MKKRLVGLTISAALIVAFQNCSKVSFNAVPEASSLGASGDGDTNNGNATPTSVSSDILIATNLNTPVDFKVDSTAISGLKLNFQATPSAALNGAIATKSSNIYSFTYTPNFGFRGKDYAVATVTDKNGNSYKFNLTVVVGNPFQDLEPALAVRGMGCIQCHAQVSSNIVTDFGYKNDYYFGQKPANSWWNNGSVYGDHGNSFWSIAMPSDKNVIVPQAALPANVPQSATQKTLADYIRNQFSFSDTTTTKAVQVIEKSSVYIGAPVAGDIIAAFKMADSDRMKYYKDSDSSVALSGLTDQGTFFQNSGTLNCEGDLAIRGPLLLDNLQINSRTGCRLYVIGSVFMYGPVTYTTTDTTRNLEITSTKSISMGLGAVKKNGSFCESGSRYETDNANYGNDSLVNRYSTFWTVGGQFVRQSTDPKAFGDSVVAEANVIAAKAGTLYDASCRSEGRNVSFERILLNAPIVHSRYEGNVSGTVIAEFSIMSLGMFKFSFDQVFKTVPVFPFLDKKTYLDVE